MNDKENVNYTITWQQSYTEWIPMIAFRNGEELPDPEITDLTEAQEVLAKIMSM